MNNIKLKECEERCEKLLGVQIEYNLKWHRTIAALRLKLKSRLAGLMKLRYVVPYNSIKIITRVSSIASWYTVFPSRVGVTELIWKVSKFFRIRLHKLSQSIHLDLKESPCMTG